MITAAESSGGGGRVNIVGSGTRLLPESCVDDKGAEFVKLDERCGVG